MRVLITGENGYIGNSLATFQTGWDISRINLRKPLAEDELKGCDAVVHAAALVHRKEKNSSWDEYYKVNTELSYELAQKCKDAGVGHFVFLSTMSVFEGSSVIDGTTVPMPESWYGRSKLLAEQMIAELDSDNFRVTVIRPPMVYGKNCPGNFSRLIRLAEYTQFFPLCRNKRSMIYIEHLLTFIKLIIDKKKAGVFHPQNDEYVCTSDMVELIRKKSGKKTIFVPGFGFLNRIGISVFKKLFSDMVYAHGMDNFDYPYCMRGFEETVYLSL